MISHREDEIAERRERRLKRWFDVLPSEKRQFDPAALSDLLCRGMINNDGTKTPAGELEMHQLELLEWMAKHSC